jgi:hypothetical protein
MPSGCLCARETHSQSEKRGIKSQLVLDGRGQNFYWLTAKSHRMEFSICLVAHFGLRNLDDKLSTYGIFFFSLCLENYLFFG